MVLCRILTSGDEVNKQFWSTMASSMNLEVFNANEESIDDYKEYFGFQCMVNQISEGWKKALFLSRIGRDALAELKP